VTDKQRAFVREYILDWNATAAAHRAGYSDPSYGRQLLTNPHVAAELARVQDSARTDAILTLSELQEWWSASVRGEHPDARYSDRQKASEMLAKSQGGFTERVEHTGGTRIEVVYVDAD
jgi:phage terminase small subunit